jgi:hypothetical protein
VQPHHGRLERERQQLREDQVGDQRAGLPQGPQPRGVTSTAAISCQIPRQTARGTQDGSAAAEALSGSAVGGPGLGISTAPPVSPSAIDLLARPDGDRAE